MFADFISKNNIANKGIVRMDNPAANTHVSIQGDPALADFGVITHWPLSVTSSSKFPLTGYWVDGAYIMNGSRGIVNDPSTGDYVILGWTKSGTDSNGSIGAGFKEVRAFIENIV